MRRVSRTASRRQLSFFHADAATPRPRESLEAEADLDLEPRQDRRRGVEGLTTAHAVLGAQIDHGATDRAGAYMDLAFSEKALKLQQAIKAQFDPKGLLNPGKIWPMAV